MSAELILRSKELFARVFQEPANVIVCAPGRVNLIGEHTDYNEGFAMPFCIGKYTVIAARRRTGATCRITSAGVPGAISTFPGDSSLSPGPEGDWTNYVRGVVFGMLPMLPGGSCAFDAAVVSDVPLGSGLSSSASLEVATATLLESIYRLGADPKGKALVCQKAEQTFCNSPCGITDQFVCACGEAGHALLIDCRPPYATESVPLSDPRIALVVADSNVKPQLSGSEYPDRVQQCKDACAAMQAAGHSEVRHLRDATLSMLETVARSHALPEATVRRARHGISEDQRTLQAKEALKACDYAQVGRLMFASHASLRDDYRVSSPELDALVEIARGVPGVHGSRLTGGGFGGCTVTLLSRSAVPALLAAFEAEYPKRAGGRTASVFVVRPAAGAMLLQQGAGAEPLAGAPLSPQLSGVAKVTAALVLSAVAAAVIASKRQR
mmetsp:Transcript_24849/g.82666  ORF Transcript_24849/g.82666 Transcript_24849/m.82666 type:complete len:440 (+) Transcript_24849:93-1412(+)